MIKLMSWLFKWFFGIVSILLIIVILYIAMFIALIMWNHIYITKTVEMCHHLVDNLKKNKTNDRNK
jgi:hypothetical protein